MADKTITELTELVAATDTDEFIIWDKVASVSKKIKYQNVKDHAPKSHGNEGHSSAFITGSQVPANETDPSVDASLKGVTKTEVQTHAPASHGNEGHSSAFITGSQVPANETDPSVDASLKGVTKTEVQTHAPASHGNEGHSSAFNVVAVEVGTGTTKSLTTVANQRVVVIVKGDWAGSASAATIKLNYNAVQKDIVGVKQAATTDKLPFCLQYSEIPGAATYNITVVASLGSLTNVVILVFKIL